MTKIILLFLIAFLGVSVNCCFAQAGSLDNTFGLNGIVTTGISTADDVSGSIAIQTDGKILIGGRTDNSGDDDFSLIRYNVNGTLDNSFDLDGIVTTDIAGFDESGGLVLLQPDGKILQIGTYYADGTLNTDYALVRYNIDGTLDFSFDSDGIVTTDLPGVSNGIMDAILQPDGKIIVVAQGNFGSTGNDFVVSRYNTDGSLDNTFDADGIATADITNSSDYPHSVSLQTDGKIIVAGMKDYLASADIAVLRFNNDGSIDNTFGIAGIVVTPIGSGADYCESVTIQPDGKIVVGGSSTNGTDFDFAVIRYNSDGSIDTSFDLDGIVTTDIGTNDMGYSLQLQSDGKIILSGHSYNGTSRDFAVVRYNTDGAIDLTFDIDGKVTTDIVGEDEESFSSAIQSDEKIILVGYTFNGLNNDFAVIRYFGNGALDLNNYFQNSISVFPNPTNGQLTITLAEEIKNGSITIQTITGQIIREELNLSGSTFTFELENVANGIYFLEIKDAENHQLFKVLKN